MTRIRKGVIIIIRGLTLGLVNTIIKICRTKIMKINYCITENTSDFGMNKMIGKETEVKITLNK